MRGEASLAGLGNGHLGCCVQGASGLARSDSTFRSADAGRPTVHVQSRRLHGRNVLSHLQSFSADRLAANDDYPTYAHSAIANKETLCDCLLLALWRH